MTSLPHFSGDPGSEVLVLNELRRAGIQAFEGELVGEVPSRVYGRLGPIVFRRAWRYWIASGPVPAAVAEDIYAAPAGRSVRVNGNGMARAHEAGKLEWRLPDGTPVVPTDEEVGFRGLLARFPEIEGVHGPRVFHDDPRALGATAYVPLYHVDSLEGLGLLSWLLRKHGVHEATRPPWWDRCS